MKNLKVLFLLLFGQLTLCAAYGSGTKYTLPADTARFTLASVLQSDMVIQQAKPFQLWGTAPAGSAVTVKADWSKKDIVVRADADGQWSTTLPVPAAAPGNFDPHTLLISHKEDTVKLKNLLIGEVWLCSGQSNIDMEMKAAPPWLEGVIDYEKEIAAANHPAIRFINIENKFTKLPQLTANGEWKACTPETAGELSGVAYYFGRELV